ncbi:28S ribosomal protein S9, mitochondrial [Bagarius yarrelli]|uniref:28S ribosomal protein S9, mitochondrial n=1 Tax=Bagarius yarrelli TaxID=175774 RepID=A0A556TT63_BAGYA|nr:28S ribosomal protein S9, mitochondrial [Bagarius yarrelli]
MAASSGSAVRTILSKCGKCSWTAFITPPNINRQLISRQICVSSAAWRKNLAAAGPEKFSEEYIKKQIEEFNIGKRHLANMMGEDPETFTQEDIDRCIAYLFPSGLFEKKARPIMKHPDLIFPKQAAVQWGEDGRPFHYLFYTGKQAYFSLMHEMFGKVLAIEKYQDKLRSKGLFSQDTKQISLSGGRWVLKEELEQLLIENISDHDYARFLQLMERLLSLPYGSMEEEFVQPFRRTLELQTTKQQIPAPQHTEDGVAFSQAEGRRKSSKASVTLRDRGSGCITINGRNYMQYFTILQDREQLMFPLHFVDMLGRFDVEASVEGGGPSSQSGALRLAISRALLSFSQRKAEAWSGWSTQEVHLEKALTGSRHCGSNNSI